MIQGRPDIHLSRPVNAGPGVFGDFLVVGNPPRHAADGEDHRVHLRRNPQRAHDDATVEIYVGIDILKSLGIRRNGIEIISCPGCGRLEIDLMKLVSDVEERLNGITLPRPIKVAILGCVVNGPGEASEADIGIAGGRGKGMFYKDGKLVRSFKEEQLVDELVQEIGKFAAEQ